MENEKIDSIEEVIRQKKEQSKKIKRYFFIGVIGFVFMVIAVSSFVEFDKTSNNGINELKEELVVEPVKTRVDSIQMQFSSWDGSHRKLERYIKDNMNDPDSYDHVETRYSDYGSYLLVATKFRGKNAFGGTVLNVVTAKVDINGNVFKIVSNE